ncbi:outer dynein arm-docking complex subunit 4 isoform X1 [Clupea harengus]|uniref:Outer dynein arm-docking complex subunit 4 isoform X1 n=2 Tax=Clupea harengus TaxID=7950 RepID=A0A8M1KEQ8_CLUHA|nr:outer dynein arm-docking complex subunit 4 isoform X1 [Clupea harengus]
MCFAVLLGDVGLNGYIQSGCVFANSGGKMSEKEEGEQGPNCTFSTYMAEGDQLFHKRDYVKAIESYTTALTLQTGEKNCLVARSRCFVKMGDSENALRDAEASLKEDKEFFKGLYQKAEALYTMGDFEFALVFYHRGHKLRPELQEFRLGIQKAQEAINNSVGSPSSVKLENKGDLSFCKSDERKKSRAKGVIYPVKKEHKLHGQKTPKTEKTAKQLLGELYSDKEYLEKLLKDEDLVKGRTSGGERLQDLILSCISYLDTRTEFWQQQKPIYARQRDRKLLQQQWNNTRPNPLSDPTHYVLTNLDQIDTGNAQDTLKRASEVLKVVQGWTEEALPNKKEVLGNLHSCIGNAHMDLEDMDQALDHHHKDLELAKQSNRLDLKSRALDNIGRVYARIGNFQKAIEVWEEKVPLVQDGLERTWLFHEIGRCYLELKQHDKAQNYGSQSLTAANEISDEKWQLNANVLIAQAELKLCNYESCVSHFETALDLANLLQDHPARDAIKKALSEAKDHTTQ